MKKTGAIIQARTDSTRLPNKALLNMPYDSKTTVLENIVERAKRTRFLSEIIIATSDKKEDDAIENLSKKLKVCCFRGDKHDVLSRYYHAAKKYELNCIARLTGDNPCIDIDIIDRAVSFHIKENNDYTATKNYPVGLNAEIFSFSALEAAHKNAAKDYEKEHVSPYICETRPRKFKISFLEAKNKLDRPDIRLTLDTEEDYALLCEVYGYLYDKSAFFTVKDIIKLFTKKPWLLLINKKVLQKKTFSYLKDEIKEAVFILNLQDLKRAADLLKNKKIASKK